MQVFASTDVGRVRKMNQDSYYISKQYEEAQVFILADGMGGYNGGEIASKLAVETARNYIANNYKNVQKDDKESILDLIKNAIEYANLIVYEKSKTDKELEEMGTTLDICLIYNNKLYIGHVGDSRIYRIRKNIIRKLTTDHSYVETLVKDGTITREEASNHPKKNMLMKALGCTAYVEPDLLIKGYLKGDIILLNSDGLTNMLTDAEIYDIIKENETRPDLQLIKMANKNGGYDNITVIIIKNN